MKFKKRIVMLVLSLFVLCSCTTGKEYEQLMQKGEDAIVEKKMDEAVNFFELALEEKPKDQKATIYQKQLINYTKALKDKSDGKYEAAIKQLDKVIATKKASSLLIKYAKAEKKEIKRLENEAKKETKNEEENVVKNETENEKIEEETENQPEVTKPNDTLWDTTKSEKLDSFVVQWGSTMGQSYKKYDNTTSVDLYGLLLPESVLNKTVTVAVNKSPVTVEWSSDGVGQADYQLVSVYSDAETQPYLQKHVYFFMFQNNQPIILATQQNQGNPENYLHFFETENEDLKNGFYEIVKN